MIPIQSYELSLAVGMSIYNGIIASRHEAEGDMMSDDFYDSVESAPQESVMEHVAALAQALREAEADVSAAEDALTDAKARLQTAKDSVVQFYSSQNISKLVLATGETVEVSEKLTCSQIKDEARLKKAYAWLRQHDGDYLIKRKLEVEELDDEFVADLTAAGYKEGADFAVKEAVNTASLKSFLSEKLGRKSAVATVAIEDVPAEFGLYIFNEVTIKGAK